MFICFDPWKFTFIRITNLIENKIQYLGWRTIMNKLCFVAFDLTLKNIMRDQNKFNNEKSLKSDFKPISSLVRKWWRYDIVKSPINF